MLYTQHWRITYWKYTQLVVQMMYYRTFVKQYITVLLLTALYNSHSFIIHFLAPLRRRFIVFFIAEVGVDVLVTVSRLLCVVIIVIDVGVASEREICSKR